MKDYDLITLSNGIRIVHKQVLHTQIVHCGIFLDIGSRDETPVYQGIAHFWEHMAFKGTRKRKSFHILNSIDALGGELNAFTDKEKIVFHASVRQRYVDKAIELLADITFDSVFPENQIERERNVILEEMAMYQDDPDDSLFDEFDHVVFGNHPMGLNILGTPDTVKSFRRKDFKNFIRKNISTDRVVFASTGSMSAEKIFMLAEKYLARVPKLMTESKRLPLEKYKAKEIELYRSVNQARCAIGRTAFPIKHQQRLPFFMLMNILGGPFMNSKLNLALREKRGFVYAVDASYTAYSDTGIFGIFFGTEPARLDKSVQLVLREMQELMDKPLSSRKLATAKEQIKGQLALMEENNQGLMLMMGRSVIDTGKVPSFEAVEQRILDIEADELQNLAQKMFAPAKLSILKMLPQN